jgi:hypothetical protein
MAETRVSSLSISEKVHVTVLSSDLLILWIFITNWHFASTQRHKDFQTRKHPLPEKESNGPVPKKQFKDGWGDDDAQKARTRYVVPMCDMNQSAVLANHFGLGFHAFVSGGRFEPAIRKAVKDFLKGSGSIPTAQANKNVFKYLQNVVVAITESA